MPDIIPNNPVSNPVDNSLGSFTPEQKQQFNEFTPEEQKTILEQLNQPEQVNPTETVKQLNQIDTAKQIDTANPINPAETANLINPGVPTQQLDFTPEQQKEFLGFSPAEQQQVTQALNPANPLAEPSTKEEAITIDSVVQTLKENMLNITAETAASITATARFATLAVGRVPAVAASVAAAGGLAEYAKILLEVTEAKTGYDLPYIEVKKGKDAYSFSNISQRAVESAALAGLGESAGAALTSLFKNVINPFVSTSRPAKAIMDWVRALQAEGVDSTSINMSMRNIAKGTSNPVVLPITKFVEKPGVQRFWETAIGASIFGAPFAKQIDKNFKEFAKKSMGELATIFTRGNDSLRLKKLEDDDLAGIIVNTIQGTEKRFIGKFVTERYSALGKLVDPVETEVTKPLVTLVKGVPVVSEVTQLARVGGAQIEVSGLLKDTEFRKFLQQSLNLTPDEATKKVLDRVLGALEVGNLSATLKVPLGQLEKKFIDFSTAKELRTLLYTFQDFTHSGTAGKAGAVSSSASTLLTQEIKTGLKNFDKLNPDLPEAALDIWNDVNKNVAKKHELFGSAFVKELIKKGSVDVKGSLTTLPRTLIDMTFKAGDVQGIERLHEVIGTDLFNLLRESYVTNLVFKTPVAGDTIIQKGVLDIADAELFTGAQMVKRLSAVAQGTVRAVFKGHESLWENLRISAQALKDLEAKPKDASGAMLMQMRQSAVLLAAVGTSAYQAGGIINAQTAIVLIAPMAVSAVLSTRVGSTLMLQLSRTNPTTRRGAEAATKLVTRLTALLVAKQTEFLNERVNEKIAEKKSSDVHQQVIDELNQAGQPEQTNQLNQLNQLNQPAQPAQPAPVSSTKPVDTSQLIDNSINLNVTDPTTVSSISTLGQ